MRTLIADSDIIELSKIDQLSIDESRLANTLRRYNLKNGLVNFGQFSFFLFNNPKSHNRTSYKDPGTGVFVTQFILAYLTNILLISRANDYKRKLIGDKDNALALCSIYFSHIVDPLTSSEKKEADMDDFLSFMIRTNTEQVEEFQAATVYEIARSIVIYTDIIYRITPQNIDMIQKVFQEKNNLSFREYLLIAFAIFAGAAKTATFNLDMFLNANIPQLKGVLTNDKISSFLKILTADYKTFRQLDTKMNESLEKAYTKNRFNPLTVYPIIETDDKKQGDPFIIPNASLYIRRAFTGLYWWFHQYFEEKNKHLAFRTYFGKVFEEYAGVIIKDIYKSDIVSGEITYGKDNQKFVDWHVIKNNKVYLFEIKSNRFALKTRQFGKKDSVSKEVNKIIDVIKQIHDRIRDINKFEKLSAFRNKEIISIIVFYDMPFISESLYRNMIENELEKVSHEEKYKNIKETKVHLMNMEDLEFYEDIKNKINLESLFDQLSASPDKNLKSLIYEINGNNSLRNSYLDKVYNDFFKEALHETKE